MGFAFTPILGIMEFCLGHRTERVPCPSLSGSKSFALSDRRPREVCGLHAYPQLQAHLLYTCATRDTFSSHLPCPSRSHEHPWRLISKCKFFTISKPSEPTVDIPATLGLKNLSAFLVMSFHQTPKGKQFVCPLSLLRGAWSSVEFTALLAQLSGGPIKSHNRGT